VKPGVKKEFLFLESVGFIDSGKTSEELLNNLRTAAQSYKAEDEQMRKFLEQQYPNKKIYKQGLYWHIVD
jgi:hypothetical protein